MVTPINLLLVALAAVAGGAINALAGGGTLITFPLLMAVGVPAVAANVTNTVALSPGYFSAALAQRQDLKGQKQRLWLFVPAGFIGGILGGILLLHTREQAFRALVPYLILFAAILLALQDQVRQWLVHRIESSGGMMPNRLWTALPVLLAAIYGGYFGAGVSVIILAVIGISLSDSITRLNALKQAIAFGTNLAAALLFLFSKQVVWPAAAIMAAGAILGGFLGGKLAGRMKPAHLRWTISTLGVVVASIFWIYR